MNRKVTQLPSFIDALAKLLRTRKLLQKDFDDFKREIAEHPELGSMIQGTGGVRKIRLKSAHSGKRGGDRKSVV